MSLNFNITPASSRRSQLPAMPSPASELYTFCFLFRMLSPFSYQMSSSSISCVSWLDLFLTSLLKTPLLQAEGDVGLGNSHIPHSHHKHCWALISAYAGESQDCFYFEACSVLRGNVGLSKHMLDMCWEKRMVYELRAENGQECVLKGQKWKGKESEEHGAHSHRLTYITSRLKRSEAECLETRLCMKGVL